MFSKNKCLKIVFDEIKNATQKEIFESLKIQRNGP